jgi:hypothetical protein
MRCLYCGKELALLKRLTGGAEFCSEAHKKSYQEEYNRIALTRLLQAQAKTARKVPLQEKATPPAVTVAVEEPVEELIEEPIEKNLEEKPEEGHLEPVESAGFLLEQPAISVPPEALPYVEPWLETAPRPSAPTWLFDGAVNWDLPSAGLLPLEFRPRARDSERSIREVTAQEVNVTPNEFADAAERMPVPFSMAPSNTLKGAGPFPHKIRPQAPNPRVLGAVEALSRHNAEPEYGGSVLLGMFSSTIDFPEEDAEVAVISPAITAVEVEPVDAASLEPEREESTVETTPNAALGALAKVHLEPAGEKKALVESEAATVVAEPEHAIPEPTLGGSTAAVQESAANAPSETAPSEEGESSPRASTDFIEITVRSCAPPKAIPASGAAATREKPALLPRLTGLPLRPKVALAPNQSAATPKAQTAKTSASAVKDTVSSNVPGSAREREAKPPVKTVSAIPPVQSKPATPPAPPRSVKPASPAQPAPVAPAAAVAKAAQPVNTSSVNTGVNQSATPSSKAAPGVEAAATKTPGAKSSGAAQKPPVPKEARRPQEPEAPAGETTAPTFGSMQLGNPSIWGSLKFKLGIALVLVVVSCTAYLGWGTKTNKLPSVAPKAADAPGPSIMVGEGGWVEGWAGDPAGVHVGRQITIYRPSLKLADYRVEFQGQIDTSSIGWVFRAADPENYYAMKLSQVSGGLAPKLALFKYLVANGRQTQVGRVPIDLTLGPDMMLKIRMDVRGPRFSTYLQGQQVDVWTDDQLKTGGVGFLNEREERGRIKSVSIYYLNGGNK